MDVLYDLRDTIRNNMLSVLAIAFIVITVVWFGYFLSTDVLPQWTARQELAAQLLAAQQNSRQGEQAEQNSAEALQAQLADIQSNLNATTGAFLSEAQAAAILDSLYRYAASSSVTITGLQAQSAAEPVAPNALYSVQAFTVQVTGPVLQLLDFLGRFEETTWPGVSLSGVKLAQGEGQSTLDLGLALYTSPLATGAVPEAAPLLEISPSSANGTAVNGASAAATAPAADLTALVNSLYEPWMAENWPEAIRILEQILAQTPDDFDMKTRLYAAYLYHGYQLSAAQQPEEAKAALSRALEFRPDGLEASTALQRVNNGLPATAVTP
ncbi:MAG: tetratricopeptide repeat protein [Chloroflexi bacterium]|nr:tetratricopeptide repeat protein [Chloroflexota bacterium]